MSDSDQAPQKDIGPENPEIRIDPLSGLKVIVAASRADRPGGLTQVDEPPPIDRDRDPFAEGHETMTPAELWADRDGGEPDSPGWRVRAVPNLYPALASPAVAGGDFAELADPLNASRGMPEMFASRTAIGHHEVIVNSPDSVRSMSELSAEQVGRVVAAWRLRMRAVLEQPATAFAHLIVNEGEAAGASLPHTHAQLYGLPFVPAAIARERERSRAYWEQTQGHNLLEDMLAQEVRLGSRLIAIDDQAALIAPFAARSPFQLMLIPRRPHPSFERDSVGAAMLHEAFRRLKGAHGATPALNIWVRTAPGDEDTFCWRIDIVPRLGQPAGMEFGAGVFINARAPEEVAAILRDV